MHCGVHTTISPNKAVNIARVCDESGKVAISVIIIEAVFLILRISQYGFADNLRIDTAVFLCIFCNFTCQETSVAEFFSLNHSVIHVVILNHLLVPFVIQIKSEPVFCHVFLAVAVLDGNTSWIACSESIVIGVRLGCRDAGDVIGCFF